jgi:hypothetical protein
MKMCMIHQPSQRGQEIMASTKCPPNERMLSVWIGNYRTLKR